jgi:hypothetical protein
MNRYRKQGLCRALQVHCKGQKMHDKAFVVRFSRKCTAKAAQQCFAWQRTFAVRFFVACTTKDICRASLAHEKKVLTVSN